MHARLPYTYHANVLARRAREPRIETYGAYADVDLAEIDLEDAPVALTWEPNVIAGGNSVPEPGSGLARWHDGSHWQPYLVGRYGDEQTMRHAGPAQWAASRGNNHLHATPLGYLNISALSGAYLDDFASGKIVEIEQAAVRRIDWTTINQEREELLESCRLFAVIDGKVWVRRPEPHYRVTRSGDTVKVSLTDSAPLNAPGWEYFSVGRYDDMMDHLASTYPGKEVHACGRVHVNMPSTLLFQDETCALAEAANRLVEHGFSLIKLASMERANEWFHLRDALAAVTGEGDGFELLEVSVERFAAAFAEDGFVAETASKALDRWRMRPMREEDGYVPPGP